MKEIKKQFIIVGVLVILITSYTIFMKFQFEHLEHQRIAYEQFKEEDCRQARLFNTTFATSEEEFLKKIENFPEPDQIIAKALYEKKPVIEAIKEKMNEDKTGNHYMLNDTRQSLMGKGIFSLREYLNTYNIRGTISMDEFAILYDEFGPMTDKNMTDEEFGKIIYDYGILTADIKPRGNPELDNIIGNQTLETIRAELDAIITANSQPLEYQETITTNGIKTASDYLLNI